VTPVEEMATILPPTTETTEQAKLLNPLSSERVWSEFESQLDAMEHEQKLDEFRKQTALKKEMETDEKLIDEIGEKSVAVSQRKPSNL
jgi:hypothetical protein